MGSWTSSSKLQRHYSYVPANELIAHDVAAELALIRGKDIAKDPHYVLASDLGLFATLGYTGMVQRIEDHSRRPWSTLLERSNAYGNFRTHDGQSPEQYLDKVYRIIHGLDFFDEGERRLFQSWRGQRVLARFKDQLRVVSDKDIIADFNDAMVVGQISLGCRRSCIYCPERGGLYLFDKERIRTNLREARRFDLAWHGSHLERRDEGFLNGADLLYFRGAHGRREIPEPQWIIEEFRRTFPEVQKLRAFFGVTTLSTTPSRELRDYYQRGLDGAVIGIESLHPPTSRFLGKRESQQMKVESIEKLMAQRFKAKLVVQVGVVGEAFYDDEHGRWISGREGLEETASVAARLLGTPMQRRSDHRRTKLSISRYRPIPGTPLEEMMERGEVVHPYRTPERMEEDVQFLRAELQRRGVAIHDPDVVEDFYDDALEGRRSVPNSLIRIGE